MILNPCIEVQTSPVDHPSVPAWFVEVVLIAAHLRRHDVLIKSLNARVLPGGASGAMG